jgi:hypothetical protein
MPRRTPDPQRSGPREPCARRSGPREPNTRRSGRRETFAQDDRARHGALTALTACLALAAVVAFALMTAGCGGPKGGVAHFSDPTYGISIDVDRRLTQWRTASVASAGAFEVSFVDTSGAIVAGRHLDALTVSLVNTGTSPNTQQAAQLNAALRTLGAAMVAKLGPNARAGAVSDVSLNGLTGVVVPYGVTAGGRPVVGWLYVLASGGRIYVLTAGATADQWNTYRPLFSRAIASFKAS